ncbi:hypothetical protein F4778DRAFT_764546 [Xylariomycetidae sp. FL2044]|nr:hypothetical protein F4778DRAFT_764546 [Xylariomycetidae sp. FL2044]
MSSQSRPGRPSFGHYDFSLRDPYLNEPSRRPRANSRLPELRPPRSPHTLVESSSDSDDIPVSKPHRPATHSRSMSHPFPSLFSSKKKKNAANDNQPSNGTPVNDHDPRTRVQAPPPQGGSANPRRAPTRGPIDFATGNCMTCASLVRWPKELQTFRCTICLTINDLQPHTPVAGNTATRPGTRGPLQVHENGHVPSAAYGQTADTISLGHTRALIRQCLRSAIHAWISARSEPDTTQAWSAQPPPHVPDAYYTNRDSPSKSDASPSSLATPPSCLYNAVFDDFSDLTVEPNPLNRTAPRSYSTSHTDTRSSVYPPRAQTVPIAPPPSVPSAEVEPKRIFKKLEDYLVMCFGSHSCVNNSFVTRRMSHSSKIQPDPAPRRVPENRREPVRDDAPISELDPKLLLLGDFAENGSWWTGSREEAAPTRVPSRRNDDKPSIVSARSPRIDWGEVMEWYHAVINAAESWLEAYQEMFDLDPSNVLSEGSKQQLEALILEAQEHLQRTLLKSMEMLLKRPGRTLAEPQDVRFLLFLLSNPLLVSNCPSHAGHFQHLTKGKQTMPETGAEQQAKAAPGRHSGIIKRILGLLANSSEQCHQHLIVWFSRLPEHMFLQIKDLISGFVTYRLNRQSDKKIEPKVDVTSGLIPEMRGGRSGNNHASMLHAALENPKPSKNQKQPVEPSRAAYTDDWQIRAAARVMALIFSANNLTYVRRRDGPDGRSYGHLLTTSDFYNTLVDCLDFKADFELWESKRGRFTFCQYPFFLSIWAKIQILEADAKRQMAGKAREAFFDSILTHRNYTQHLVFTIRRDCLVDDSLKKVSEVVGSGSEDIKKALRIEFQGEEGVDGGGLRKEWFLLLVREVFNPDHGLFVYDEDSQYCYFNPSTFETSDQFFLVGVVLGLAIYNSTILDVALPPFAFRKLLASAPQPASGGLAHPRPIMNYTLDDLAEFRPALARGLRQLLDFEGDVQSTFCLDFVIEVEKYGTRVRVPLCSGGETKMVTNTNRKEYVDLYVRFLLDTSVSRQFEPFKRGFFTVCAGNALTLFRPEEIELLIRGSDEALDITSLKGAAVYTSWPKHSTPDTEPTIRWFWDTFETAPPQGQRRLLSFITGSDRIPAMGAASLVIRINCLGEDEGRYPSARTCFNVLSLYRCQSRERLKETLWRAVNESEGFGLK